MIFGQYLETPAIVLCVCSLFIGKVDSKSYRVYHKKLLHITPFCFRVLGTIATISVVNYSFKHEMQEMIKIIDGQPL